MAWTTLRSMTSGLLTVDDDGHVLSLNPAGEEIIGLGAQALTGQLLSARLPTLAAAVEELATGESRRRRATADVEGTP